jgi:hypothetical protein
MAEYRFVMNKAVEVEETRYYEFKEVKSKKPLEVIKNTSDEYVVAFLNSEGGRIFWGIRGSDRHAVGVLLTARERDELRRIVTEKLNQIQPAISPTAYQINLHRIFQDDACEIVEQDRYIVEIVSPRSVNNDLYATASGEVWVKTDSGKRKLSVPGIQDEVRRRNSHKNQSPERQGSQAEKTRVVEGDIPSVAQKSADVPPNWTEYTQDKFGEIIWRWHYKPEFDDTPTPRDLKPHCAECNDPLEFVEEKELEVTHGGEKKLQWIMQWNCPTHPERRIWYRVLGRRNLFWVYNQISQKIKDGSWKAVVMKQRNKTSN